MQFDKDEHNRPDTTFETLARLKPAFRPNGTITAGNAPGLNDAAAAMVLTDATWGEKHGVAATARLVAYGIAAVEPGMFGLGPVPAVKQALQRAGWDIRSIERIEINEAFAAIAIVVARELGLPDDIVNVEGRRPRPSDRRHRRSADHQADPLNEARWSQAWRRHALHRRRPGYRFGDRKPALKNTERLCHAKVVDD